MKVLRLATILLFIASIVLTIFNGPGYLIMLSFFGAAAAFATMVLRWTEKD